MLDLNWLLLVTGIVIPMLTGLVTNRLAHPGLKAAVLALLAAVAGIGNELYTVGGALDGFSWSSSLSNAVATFLLGVGLHFGLLKPIGLTGSTGTLQTGALAKGIGAKGPNVSVPGSELPDDYPRHTAPE